MLIENYLNVRSAHPWNGYTTAQEAVSIGKKDFDATQEIPVVSAGIGKEIVGIAFSDTWLSLLFGEYDRLTLAVDDYRIVASSVALSVLDTADVNANQLRLRFEPTAYAPDGIVYEWDREKYLLDRIGQRFLGLQISQGQSYLYVTQREVLTLSVLEILGENGALSPLLIWGEP